MMVTHFYPQSRKHRNTRNPAPSPFYHYLTLRRPKRNMNPGDQNCPTLYISSNGTLSTPGRVTELQTGRDKIGRGCTAHSLCFPYCVTEVQQKKQFLVGCFCMETEGMTKELLSVGSWFLQVRAKRSYKLGGWGQSALGLPTLCISPWVQSPKLGLPKIACRTSGTDQPKWFCDSTSSLLGHCSQPSPLFIFLYSNGYTLFSEKNTDFTENNFYHSIFPRINIWIPPLKKSYWKRQHLTTYPETRKGCNFSAWCFGKAFAKWQWMLQSEPSFPIHI